MNTPFWVCCYCINKLRFVYSLIVKIGAIKKLNVFPCAYHYYLFMFTHVTSGCNSRKKEVSAFVLQLIEVVLWCEKHIHIVVLMGAYLYPSHPWEYFIFKLDGSYSCWELNDIGNFNIYWINMFYHCNEIWLVNLAIGKRSSK